MDWGVGRNDSTERESSTKVDSSDCEYVETRERKAASERVTAGRCLRLTPASEG